MKQIIYAKDIIYSYIDAQEPFPHKQYKLSPFIVVEYVNDGVLLYNLLTYSLILLEDENEFVDKRNFLIRSWFYLSEDIDPYTFAFSIKQIYRKNNKRFWGSINSFTIFTTLNCNARCFYCYEKEMPKYPMTQDTALKVVDYITRVSSKGKISLQWFGGEPLYNGRVITTICNELTIRKISFSSTMISNGYMFDCYSMETIKNVWNLEKVQITLDGPESIYNQTKNYIRLNDTDNNINPFETVLKNIDILLQNDIKINIRLNLSSYNIKSMYQLIDTIDKRFNKYKNNLLYVYSYPLFGTEGESVQNDYIEIDKYLLEKGLLDHYNLTKLRIMDSCIANNMRSVTIMPNGNLGLCEHFTEDELIGNINNVSVNIEKIAEWQQPYFIEYCKECMWFPQCIKLRKCPNAICNNRYRKHLEFRVRESMKNEYIKWKF